MKMTPDICPVCKGTRIDRDNRLCLNCFFTRGAIQTLLLPGDDGHRSGDEEWFLWMNRGPRGTGWYRRCLLESRPIADSPMLDASDPYQALLSNAH